MTSAYRPDVDGLRAISILLVITFHAFPALLPGGFLGVDVFFVISGFLITGLLLGEKAGSGRIHIPAFYARRVRRLFPALFLVTSACLAFGWLALLPAEYAELGKHALGGALFVPNFVLWSEAGYWDTASELKPLLHLWSLGVEEQFYLFWPATLMLMHRLRAPLLAVMAPLAVLSFAASVHASGVDPDSAFFLPQYRIWELMLGGMLAVVSRGDGRKADGVLGSGALAGAAGFAGLALVVAAAVLFGRDARYSAPQVLAAALGSLLVIAAGMRSATNRLVLANPAMVLLGRISYPLYLWHWPALSFATITETETPAPAWRLALLAASVVVSWLTYRFVEMPVRMRRGFSAVPALVVLYLSVGLFGGLVFARGGFPHRTEALAAQIAALEWESEGLYERDDCSWKLKVPGRCLSNGRPHQVAVLGDSFSTNVFFVLQERHRNDGTGVMRLGKRACLPFWDVDAFTKGVNRGCRLVMNGNLDYVLNNPDIHTVVLSLREGLYLGVLEGNELKLAGDPAPRSNEEVFRIALERTVRRFVDAGKTVVYALGWPEIGFQPSVCLDVRPWRLSRYAGRRCAIERPKAEAASADYRRMVRESLAKFPRTRIWDPNRVLCDEAWCWAMKDGVVLYRDDRHLSIVGSEYVGRRYESAFEE